MSVIEMFKLSNRDERLVVEANRIYAIGYFILTVGLFLDIYYGLSQVSVVVINDMNVNLLNYFNPFELLVYMTAQIACAIVAVKRGILDTNRLANTETVPWKYYLVISCVVAVVAGLASTILRALAELRILGAGSVHWLLDIISGLVLAIFVFLSVLYGLYVNFKAVKRQQAKMISAMEVE